MDRSPNCRAIVMLACSALDRSGWPAELYTVPARSARVETQQAQRALPLMAALEPDARPLLQASVQPMAAGPL
jgi:hypothetical protein